MRCVRFSCNLFNLKNFFLGFKLGFKSLEYIFSTNTTFFTQQLSSLTYIFIFYPLLQTMNAAISVLNYNNNISSLHFEMLRNLQFHIVSTPNMDSWQQYNAALSFAYQHTIHTPIYIHLWHKSACRICIYNRTAV